METSSTPLEGIEAQRELVNQLETDGAWDIVVGAAFVRGMRDIGYKNTAYALCELIDNSIQAAATHVDLIFGFEDGNKPTQLAIVDDGHGMLPPMVRASLLWGAGTRYENRKGFGKYGYGLPSASVSQARRVTVYSKTTETDWTSAYLDVDEISAGEWSVGNRITMPAEKAAQPPKFVTDGLWKLGREEIESGTVVVWDKIDRIDLKTRDALRGSLIAALGTIYRNYLRGTSMTVDGEPVEPCDPLFLTEGFRYYDLDTDRATAYPPAIIELEDKTTGEPVGTMRVRFSRLPATFFRKPEAKWNNKPGKKDMHSERLSVADSNNGVVFLRNGRQIDVVRPPRAFLAYINATTDRFWSVEVDFDASLDEEFAITTSKQQVKPSDRIWDLLKDKAHVFSAINTMKVDYKKEADLIAAEAEKTRTRASIEALADAEKFGTVKPTVNTPDRQKEADENLERAVERISKTSGVKPDIVRRELMAKQEITKWEVETEDLSGGAFYRPEQRGSQTVLILNRSHRFYTDVYMGRDSSPRLRSSLELLLFAIGIAEVNTEPDSDKRHFYQTERSAVWSVGLESALRSLSQISVITDADTLEEAS